MFKKGILAVTGGFAVRIFPPLVISRELMDSSLDVFEDVMKEFDKEYYKP
jgi:4-aminobutyrate aminotransferase-like enzyme